MTLHRDEGHWSIECDSCGSLHPAEFESKGEAIRFVQRSAWVISPDGSGGWEHECPDCIKQKPGRLEHARKMFGRQSKP